MAKKFQIHRGVGGLAGQAARLQRAASGANNAQIYAWQQQGSGARGDEGGGGNGSLTINDGGGDSFEGYDAPQSPIIIQNMDKGNAWNGAWVDRPNYVGIVALDDFELDSGSPGNNGFGFTVGWTLTQTYLGTTAQDDFESLADGANLATSTGGTGWSGAWDV